MKKISTLDLCYSAIFICFMTIGANISVWFPFLAIPIGGVSVPISLQTFFSILAGFLLGRRIATLAMVGYIGLGVIGVPVFAQMQGGPFVLFGYTGGFLISFIFVAYITGYLTEKRQALNLNYSIIVSLVGTLVNYLIGVSYMYLAMNTWLGLDVSYQGAWVSMAPFMLKDSVLALVVAFVIVKIIERLPALVKSF